MTSAPGVSLIRRGSLRSLKREREKERERERETLGELERKGCFAATAACVERVRHANFACLIIRYPPRYMPVQLSGQHFRDSLKEKQIRKEKNRLIHVAFITSQEVV